MVTSLQTILGLDLFVGRKRDIGMVSQSIKFTRLSRRDRKMVAALQELGEGDQIELRIRRADGKQDIWPLPAAAASLVGALLSRLANGERVAVLTEDQELNLADISVVLGIGQSLVVHRMNIGHLPFHYVGKHRHALAKDVLALKAQLDIRQKAVRELAEDAEDLRIKYGI